MPNARELYLLPHRQVANPAMLNHEDIALLAESLLEANEKQSFVLAGAEDLRALLPKLMLCSDGDEAFILIRPFIHSMGLYLHFEAGKVQALLFDSQNYGWRYYPSRLIAEVLSGFFENIRIIFSGSELQSKEVQEGCTEYSLAFLQYCLKHGKLLFKNYAKPEQCHSIEQTSLLEVEQLNEEAFPEELKSIAMAKQPDWHSIVREQYLAQLERLLEDEGYNSLDENTFITKIMKKVMTMQGVYQAPSHPSLRLPLYKVSIIPHPHRNASFILTSSSP